MFMELNAQSADEHLQAIRKSSEARRRYAFIQTAAMVVLALSVVSAVALLMPKAAGALDRANAALDEMEAVAGELGAITAELSAVDLAGMAGRMDALVIQSSESLAQVTEGVEEALTEMSGALAMVEGVDLKSLNESIASLSAILEPLARLFGG